ncbi:2-succinyl-6-hydroxy-2,4-cyclohexadiene-1-carboxylate synthase [Metabacillus iocasae]|uniref:Putative 2-succinyl-6-hydroxy-2,4-cyclohexadiene-1-carboxylate synthase n=1 Tax=Priestia iocasae TaxID=2291674 RepID=A0ABS2QZA5_9BACI|nr:2-succinyl-6-hydroxy-2,4-cyclohexadiene-1-carboxylate synthase [Metabacillus iocasae]MBM7704811.1 2-succinyl-6-hydroxy-2,4-cyclohexadiene-1-carboxylate synthase [Metabacillus iocasae]
MKLSVNDISYHVDVQGEGEPLLLLHGFTGSSETWKSCYDEWEGYRLISLDIIGHGQTDSPEDVAFYKMEAMCEAIASILQELNVSKAHVLGYSMGGRLALSFATRYPHYVQSLILESASPGLLTEEERESRRKSDNDLAQQIESCGIESFVNKWENIPLFASQKKLPAEIQRTIRQERLRNTERGLANSLRGMGTGEQKPLWDTLASLHLPVLLIAGADDQKFCDIANQMEKWLPKSTKKIILSAGHAIHVEQPQIFGKIVNGFIST